MLSTIETFYDCVDEGFDYGRALAAYSAVTDDTGFLICRVWPLLGRQVPLGHHNIPEDAIHAIVHGGFDMDSHDLFKNFAVIPERTPVLRRSFVSDEAHRKTRVYKEASEPWGLHSEGASILKKNLIAGVSCGFVRHPGQEEIGHEILSQMAVLNIHLCRAMGLQQQLDKLSEALIQSSNMLDLIDFGLVLYGDAEVPLFVNETARRVFNDNDGLALGSGGIVIQDRAAFQQFQELLGTLRLSELPLAARTGGMVRVPRLSRKKPYILLAVPMLAHGKQGLDKVNVVVHVFDPSVKKSTAIKLFAASYKLTRAESALALELAQGTNIDEFAAKRGVSITTARSQLRTLYAKTDTSRQHELVSLLLRSTIGIKLN